MCFMDFFFFDSLMVKAHRKVAKRAARKKHPDHVVPGFRAIVAPGGVETLCIPVVVHIHCSEW